MIFTLTPIHSGKWDVLNTLTGVRHRTYGTRAEVEEQLAKQSALWSARSGKGTMLGEGWAARRVAELARPQVSHADRMRAAWAARTPEQRAEIERKRLASRNAKGLK